MELLALELVKRVMAQELTGTIKVYSADCFGGGMHKQELSTQARQI